MLLYVGTAAPATCSHSFTPPPMLVQTSQYPSIPSYTAAATSTTACGVAGMLLLVVTLLLLLLPHCHWCCCCHCHCMYVCAPSHRSSGHQWSDGERRWDCTDKWWWWWGHTFSNAKQGRLRAKTLKPSHCGLVPGLLCQTVRVCGVGWCHLMWWWSWISCLET